MALVPALPTLTGEKPVRWRRSGRTDALAPLASGLLGGLAEEVSQGPGRAGVENRSSSASGARTRLYHGPTIDYCTRIVYKHMARDGRKKRVDHKAYMWTMHIVVCRRGNLETGARIWITDMYQ